MGQGGERMRKILPMILCLLLLGGCAKGGEPGITPEEIQARLTADCCFTAAFTYENIEGCAEVEKTGEVFSITLVEPEVLLMDEPTSALDPISTSRIEELTMELKERYTIVIVTHNMQQAVRISDRTAFFLLGELVEMGDTERLFSTPVDKRTEDYISGRFG